MEGIKNIIFDLGNVLLDLDWVRTEKAFRNLLREEFDTAIQKYESERLFERLEVGQITPEEFLCRMKQAARKPLQDDEILFCWNSILVTLPPRRIEWLQRLGRRYHLFLLSNTNAIHLNWLESHLRENSGMTLEQFNALFVKPYYSFEINLRKPDREIFDFVMQDAGLLPGETLFIDDMEENILSAQALGIRTLHHQPGTEVMEGLG